ncbi:unnamed protein product [Prorocentrum cordatum]|uniref:VOC domain-containing protein n=1 Tax=Prorocentrum cordatum TaxID=2364126 RepID=A0ABN9SIM9_9DINO|nr:unnamed protein product [Polarella glacialis]
MALRCPHSLLLPFCLPRASAASRPPRCAAENGDTCIVGLLCPSAAQVDALHARLQAAASRGLGAVDAAPARNDAFGIYNAIARDPSGYIVEVMAFLKPDFLKPPRARL